MIGKTLKHFKVEELLGKGGMGVVYRARDVRLDRPVAIKVLKPDLTADRDRQRRFLQEARAASAVTHPAIAQIYDVDEVEGMTFIAMEFVEGQTVRQLIANRELDLLGAVEIALQVSEGLSRAHKANIVHRDIKSDNIMVTPDGHAKLLDFGLAKLLDPMIETPIKDSTKDLTHTATFSQTQPGTILGTVAYMSPEQARGQQVNQSSDVFSMGIVIYEMVTGELPFKGNTPLDTMHSIAFEEIRPITVIRKNLPPELHRIISNCLRKRPDDRYKDAHLLAVDLKNLKRDIESGVQRSLPPGQKIRGIFEWLKSLIPFGPAGILVAAVSMILVGFLVLTNTSIGTVVGVVLLGLVVYRYIRNRKNRMLKRFAAKIRKFPEVQAIIVSGNQVIVVVDQAKAKIYIRINSLVDLVNKKIYFGDHIEAAVRDDLSSEEFTQILREPGVIYVRDDVLTKPEAE
ncbi:MAG: serine/threonine protein kinase [Candidatus Aminicenantes bacterium]|nr:serine/threonine protein kinase [Candidatus Aminicenantes bacterium]